MIFAFGIHDAFIAVCAPIHSESRCVSYMPFQCLYDWLLSTRRPIHNSSPSLRHTLSSSVRPVKTQPSYSCSPSSWQGSPPQRTPLRPFPHQFFQPEVLPRNFSFSLRRTLDPERGVLVWDDVVFVFRVERLKMRWNVDCFVGEVGRASKLLLDISMPLSVGPGYRL